MKLFTELLVVAPDSPHPSAEKFCPSFWEGEDFDSDGDFYYDGIDGRWTMLQLRKKISGSMDSYLEVYTFREQQFYDPGIESVATLERTLDDVKAGKYADNGTISAMKDIAVTSLTIQTRLIDDYREYLETVAMFLTHSGGVTVGRFELDADAFRHAFLGDSTV
jgi:hypothetical protein